MGRRRQFSQQVAADYLALARRNQSRMNRAVQFGIGYGEARARSLLGQYEQANQVLEDLMPLAPGAFEESQVIGLQAEISHKQGRIQRGMELYSAALRKLGYWTPKSKLGAVMGLAYEVGVQPSEASERLLSRANRLMRFAAFVSRFYPSLRAHALREHGLLREHQGKQRRALQSLERSLEVSEKQGDRLNGALTSLEYGRIKRSMSDPAAEAIVEQAQRALTTRQNEIVQAIKRFR